LSNNNGVVKFLIVFVLTWISYNKMQKISSSKAQKVTKRERHMKGNYFLQNVLTLILVNTSVYFHLSVFYCFMLKLCMKIIQSDMLMNNHVIQTNPPCNSKVYYFQFKLHIRCGHDQFESMHIMYFCHVNRPNKNM